MIIVDSREQKWGHVREYFEAASIPFQVQKLDFGDYMYPNGCISVDRKQNLDELASNLCTNDSRRFWNEVRGASKHGITLIVLCEHGHGVLNPKDVRKWHSTYSKITGELLFRKMFEVSAAYGVEFRFCSKEQTGQIIMEILGGGNGEK